MSYKRTDQNYNSMDTHKNTRRSNKAQYMDSRKDMDNHNRIHSNREAHKHIHESKDNYSCDHDSSYIYDYAHNKISNDEHHRDHHNGIVNESYHHDGNHRSDAVES